MTLRSLQVAACLLLGGCGVQDPDRAAAVPKAPPALAAALVAAPVADPGVAAAPQGVAPAQGPASAGPLYDCVSESAGGQKRAPIELPPSVETLCRKAPEMGPCQYEREACRRRGGRVYTADGTEITRQTEAEYDRRVMRIRMKSN